MCIYNTIFVLNEPYEKFQSINIREDSWWQDMEFVFALYSKTLYMLLNNAFLCNI